MQQPLCITILSIEACVGKKNSCQLITEEGDVYDLHEEVIAKHRLKPGLQVERESLVIWQNEAEQTEAYHRALRYLGYRSRSEKQVFDYLAGKGYDEINIKKVIAKLTDYGFVNDSQFAARWVRDKRLGKPMGRKWLTQGLKEKGIDETTAQEVLDSFSSEEEEQAALQLARKQFKRYQQLPLREQKVKLSQVLARRGFEWDIIRRVVEQVAVFPHNNDDNDDVTQTQ